MSENVLDSGTYCILNIYCRNFAAIVDKHGGTSLSATTDRLDHASFLQWHVVRHSNGRYRIQNVGTGLDARSAFQETAKGAVEGFKSPQRQLWQVKETRDRGIFSILCTHRDLFWSLPDKETGTPLTIHDSFTGPHTKWQFIPTTPSIPISLADASGDPDYAAILAGPIAIRNSTNRYMKTHLNLDIAFDGISVMPNTIFYARRFRGETSLMAYNGLPVCMTERNMFSCSTTDRTFWFGIAYRQIRPEIVACITVPRFEKQR